MGIPSTKNLLLYAFILCLSFRCFAQISSGLLGVLPDSCKPQPVSKKQLGRIEKIKILEFCRTDTSVKFYSELDALARDLANDLADEKDPDNRIEILTHLTTYYLATGDHEASLKFCTMVLTEMKGRKEYSDLLVSYEKIKGTLYSDLGKHEQSVRYLNAAMEHARSARNTIGVGELYYALSVPYMSLGLYGNALACLDSSLAYYGVIHKNPYYAGIYKDAVSLKFRINMNLYEETENAVYSNRLAEIRKDAALKKIDQPLFHILSPVQAYLNKDYSVSLFLCDSLLNTASFKKLRENNPALISLQKYKAKNLLQLNRDNEAVLLLRKIILLSTRSNGMIWRDKVPVVNNISLVLYQYYNQRQQWKDAIYYLKIVKKTADSMDVMQHRGHVFEVDQKYNFEKKELQVDLLQDHNEIRRNERNLAISIAIISLLVLALVIIIFFNRSRKLKLKEIMAVEQARSKLERLDLASKIQIGQLEERNRLEKLKQQKRLARELHDDLAGLLASAKVRLEHEAMLSENKDQCQRLRGISRIVEQAYRSTRKKSHEWYSLGNEEAEFTFSERVHSILANALPEDLFETEVAIDDYSMCNVPPHVCTELLSIIQEAIVNILKHSKAGKISILLYQEMQSIVMHIKDDGGGFNVQLTSKGIGLKLIRERVAEIKGVCDIKSDASGTELVVEIPLS